MITIETLLNDATIKKTEAALKIADNIIADAQKVLTELSVQFTANVTFFEFREKIKELHNSAILSAVDKFKNELKANEV